MTAVPARPPDSPRSSRVPGVSRSPGSLALYSASDPSDLSGVSGINDARPSSGQPWLVIAALTLLATACVLLAWTLDTSDRPTVAVVWGGFAVAALIFGLLCLVGGALFHDLGLGRWKVGRADESARGAARIPLLVLGENDWGTVLSSIPATGFVWLLAIAITFGRTKRE
jgi:hypothetical protein